MLIWFLTIIPVGIPLCAIIGLMYGIKNKDTIFTKCSAVALFVGIAVSYTHLRGPRDYAASRMPSSA